MKPIVYVESSVVSYLTSRPHRDVIIAGRQFVTLDWWENQRQRFELRISVLVEEEISKGDPIAAQQRLDKVADIQSDEPGDAGRGRKGRNLRTHA